MALTVAIPGTPRWRRPARSRGDARNFTQGLHGFTLIELLVAIAVLAILVNLALPSLHEFVISKNVSATTERLVAQLNLARSEALRRGGHVALGCAAAGCSNDLSAGWRVSDDAGHALLSDAGVDAGQGYRVGLSPSNAARPGVVSFTGIGALGGNAEANLFVCRPDADSAKSWRIRVLPSGAIRASRGTASVAGNPCGA